MSDGNNIHVAQGTKLFELGLNCPPHVINLDVSLTVSKILNIFLSFFGAYILPYKRLHPVERVDDQCLELVNPAQCGYCSVKVLKTGDEIWKRGDVQCGGPVLRPE